MNKDGRSMKTGDLPFQNPADRIPIDFLQKFVGVFGSKGWLNRSFRIMHRERKYRIFCSETQFLVHRINDSCEAPWGFPCWVVGMVTPDRIIEESDLSGFASADLNVHDWRRCLVEGDFKII